LALVVNLNQEMNNDIKKEKEEGEECMCFASKIFTGFATNKLHAKRRPRILPFG